MMMWDDHEIFDGYGSHNDDNSTTAKSFFLAAQKAFLEFQAINNPPALGSGSHAFTFLLNDSAFLFLDTRTHRSYVDHVVLGKAQLEQIRFWLSSMISRRLRHLYVISAIPIVHVKVVGFINFANLIGWTGGIVEDLRDSWTAPNNQAECNQILNLLFNFAKDSPECGICFLSGDAHVGTIAEIESSKREHQTAHGSKPVIPQVVSSGIGSPPPEGLAGLILRMAVADKLNLAGPDFRGSLLRFDSLDSFILARRNFAIVREVENGISVTFFAEEGDEVKQIEQRWKSS
jgi:hypothetical protein